MLDIALQLKSGLGLIRDALFADASNLWVLVPILILWLVMEFYFGEYKQEKMGWNTALANGISFTWINITAFRLLFSGAIFSDFESRIILLTVFFLYGTAVIFFSFSHVIPHRYAYYVAGPTVIYFLSVISTLTGSGSLTLSRWVFIDLFIILLVLGVALSFIKKHFLGFWGEVEAVKAGKIPEEIK